MAIIVRMPEIATGTDAAAIAGWLVAVGEPVQVGQPLAEIETEKATVEFEAESAGTLAGTLLAPGASAPVGTPIAVLAVDGESIEAALAESGGGVAAAAAATGDRGDVESAAQIVVDVASDSARPASPVEPGARVFASPLVRKLARERNLDLAAVRGTGPGGRIVRRDIEALGPTAASSRSAAPEVPVSVDALPAAPGGATSAPGAAFEDLPHTGMRRAIARRLTESKGTVPHFYLVAHCRVDALIALRAQINAVEGTRVSVNDLVVKAVAAALRDVPEANAIWTEEATRRFSGVDISVAVSVPGGLLTPVVRGVERLSVGELGAAIRDLAERARAGKLRQQELEGGSFSVSNLGMYGTSEFAAILNPPQSGILAVGAAEQRPVVESDGSLGVATMMTVTLSADHRVLDGALAAEWLAAFTKRIEQPLSLLV
ncbi:dihydrolipoamide acetyltransferase family protein [Leucobacter chromiireducens]|uniref:dihydrolipoamide acetyltransferase family protein n=1 Tax=Leucobacter chromiireducens TaxID=283877 RepID=UPI000F63E132|nr:dihydrolipoamide acetyltransferase family protein [Leucobacter chromiireducens]